MITSEKYEALKYHVLKSGFRGDEIAAGDIVGLDSEAYTSGRPFLFCTSDGRAIEPENLFDELFTHYKNCHFGLWNIKYDSGAILYDMPPGAIIYGEDNETILRFHPGKYELWTTNKTTWFYKKGDSVIPLTFEYIPHKYLKISVSKHIWVKFWDICQFYASGLDSAAQKYLGEGKGEMETKEFTLEYFQKHRKKITEYCIRDAELTARLGNFLLQKIDEFGLRVTALYSQASVSFRYYQDRGEIIGVQRYFKHYPEFLRVVMDSYQGGKFELQARGFSPALYEYDITSAYPYEISNLVNIDYAEIERSTKFYRDSTYSFFRVRLKIYDSAAMPCGRMIRGTRVYCIGEYFATITKAEYEYLKRIGAELEILDGWHLFVGEKEYPYKENTEYLFNLKSKYKGNDSMLYSLTKIMMNGFYGKFCQVIPDWKGNQNAGPGFNPVYASIITANTRLKVTELQQSLGRDCLAVHTDSIISTRPLEPGQIKKDTLGCFEYVDGPAPGVLVACGCYQIGEAGAFKGFEPREKKRFGGNPAVHATITNGKKVFETWFDILKQYHNKMEIPYKALRVESWIEATAKGHFDRINKFEIHPKNIELNADVKRFWKNEEMTGGDFLDKLHFSEPITVVEHEPPEFWRLPKHKRGKYGTHKKLHKKSGKKIGAEGRGRAT